MSTSTYYSLIGTCADKARAAPDAIEIRRHNAISPSSFATSSSNSSSSLNQFNSFTPSSTLSSSSSSSSSSTSSAVSTSSSTSNNSMTIAAMRSSPQSSKLCAMNRDMSRQTSTTPTQSQSLFNTTTHKLHSLEPKPLKPFKSNNAYLEAMKEDLAEWLNKLYSDLDLTADNFFSQLETGAIICRHANNVTKMGQNAMVDQSSSVASSLNESTNSNNDDSISDHSSPSLDSEHHSSHGLADHKLQHRQTSMIARNSICSSVATTSTRARQQRLSLTGSVSSSVGGGHRGADRTIDWFRVKIIPYKVDAQPGTFFSRDNICQFILWCRSLSVRECLLFETDDLVARKNEKSFILCLLEVARIGFEVGMPTPLIIQLEQEIDREIENDAKLQRQQLEEGAGDEKIQVAGEDDKHLSEERQRETCARNEDTNNNDNIVSITGSYATNVDKQVGDKQEEKGANGAQGNGAHNEDEPCENDFGPKPQVITNDLLSLHERVVQLLCQCTCPTQFSMVRIGDGKYKVGDKLIIFVRILRRHIMVRVGGGWQELSEFLRQKDPCRMKQPVSSQLIQQQQQSIGKLYINSPVSRSRLLGSNHYLNKVHHHYRSSGGQRSISGSASMSWLSHNT